MSTDVRVFRPLRPECALVLDGWREVLIENGMAWHRANRRPPGGTGGVPGQARPGLQMLACVDCQGDATGVAEYRDSVRCLDCNRIHAGVDERDPYEPVRDVPRGKSFYRIGEAREVLAPPVSVHPAPVYVSTDPAPIAPPAAVLALKARAETHGWSANVTYARGNGVHGSLGTPTKVVDSWALRCWYGAFRATAVCVGGTWQSMWGVAHMFHARTQAQWLEYLNEVAFGDVDAWLPGARAENLAKAAIKPCADPDVHEAHPWGENLKCKGRETAKAKRTREHGS